MTARTARRVSLVLAGLLEASLGVAFAVLTVGVLVLVAAAALPCRWVARAWRAARKGRQETGLTFSEERALEDGIALNPWFLREDGARREGKFRERRGGERR